MWFLCLFEVVPIEAGTRLPRQALDLEVKRDGPHIHQRTPPTRLIDRSFGCSDDYSDQKIGNGKVIFPINYSYFYSHPKRSALLVSSRHTPAK
jgi:hypothetical protein